MRILSNMAHEALKDKYACDGFVHGPRILNDDQVEELRGALDRVIEEQRAPEAGGPVLIRNFSKDPARVTWQIVDIWRASEPFFRLLTNPKILEIASVLSDARELRVWHDQIQYKLAAKGGVTMWHQDSPAWPVLQPKDAQVTAWVALDDVDEDNGCMSMVPGSHAWGVQQELLRGLDEFTDLPEAYLDHPVTSVLRPVKCGEVHFHHPLTWHGSHANNSGKPRRAIALHYATERTVYDSSGEHVMKPYIHVGDGERIAGELFPTLWSANGKGH